MDFVRSVKDYLHFRYPGHYIAREEYIDGVACRMVITQPQSLPVTIYVPLDPCYSQTERFCQSALGVGFMEFARAVDNYRQIPEDMGTVLTEETREVGE